MSKPTYNEFIEDWSWDEMVRFYYEEDLEIGKTENYGMLLNLCSVLMHELQRCYGNIDDICHAGDFNVADSQALVEQFHTKFREYLIEKEYIDE